MQKISVYKIRIDSIKEHAIGFELFAGEKVEDTYVNIVAKGGYGYESRLLLMPKQFLKNDFKKTPNIPDLAKVYLVSQESLGIKIGQDGLLR